jgi:formylmethanofuran dehydrogenase subunit D
MWLFTTSGFISIVEKDANHLAVRARDSLSLSSLAQSYDVVIRKTPTADYPYRVFITKDQFKNWLSNQPGQIQYKNFKSEVTITRGKKFSHALLKVWSAMHLVEDKEARSKDDNR